MAMGCTEPIAIAYAAAKAREVLGCEPDLVKICVSNNIIKNVKSVVVPNTDGMKGIEAAAVAGILGGNATKELEVISEVTANQKAAMRRFLSNVPISVEAIDNGIIFDIIIALYCGTDSAVVRISQYHTNIVYIKKNDEVLLDNTPRQTSAACNTEAESGLTDRSLLTIANIYDFAETCDLDDVRPLLDTQILYNTQISEEGLLGDYGANVGSTYLKFYGNDVRNRAIAKAAAGSDARMSGCELPVVINSGSGNQGITVSVPVIEYAKALACPKERLYRALVLSNLIAIHEKTGIGTSVRLLRCGQRRVCRRVCHCLLTGGGSESCLPHPRQRAGHRVRYHLRRRQAQLRGQDCLQRRGWDSGLPHVPERPAVPRRRRHRQQGRGEHHPQHRYAGPRRHAGDR